MTASGVSVGGRHWISVFGVALIATAAAVGAQAPAPASPSGGTVTFAKDIMPILQEKCQNCHRPESIAPMSLMSYQETRPWARSIKAKVTSHEMPPWYIDRNVGINKFANDESLSDAQIATIVKWVDGGSVLGNPADMPAARKFEPMDRWQFKPDMIVEMPKARHVQAEGPDQFADIVVDPKLSEDTWISAVEVKPLEGYRVMHHAVLTMGEEIDGAMTDPTLLVEYSVGKNADIFPTNAGRLIKAGSKFNFNLHMHSIGEEADLRVAVALKLYPKGVVPKYDELTVHVGSANDLDIPPNTDNVRFDGYSLLTKPARILAFQPHMHNRGKAMCVEALIPNERPAGPRSLPDQKVEMLSCVDVYRFAWHRTYLYADDAQPLLPAGTILHVTGWKDNTTGNRYNPDPDNWVGSGARTIDEMNFAWMSLYYLDDADYKAQVAERKVKQSGNALTNQQQ